TIHSTILGGKWTPGVYHGSKRRWNRVVTGIPRSICAVRNSSFTSKLKMYKNILTTQLDSVRKCLLRRWRFPMASSCGFQFPKETLQGSGRRESKSQEQHEE